MSGKCVGMAKCPQCGGSRVQVFEQDDGTTDAFCFSCKTVYGSERIDGLDVVEHKKSKRTPEEIEALLKEVATYQVKRWPSRKLKEEYLDYYGVKVGLSEEDGITPTEYYLPIERKGEVTGYKVRLVKEKKMWSIGNATDPDMFGWDKAKDAPSPKLFITEGEFDAVALCQALKDNNTNPDYADIYPAVVSLTHGVGSAVRNIGKLLPEIKKRFKQVVLCFDMDEQGRKAVEEVCKLGDMFVAPDLPEKDANECVIQGKSKALCRAVLTAQKPKNSRLVRATELFEESKEPAQWGLSWPWQGLTDLTRGIRFGETIYIAAAEKMGKSEVVNAVGAHLIKEHGLKVLMAKPEEANKKTIKMVNSKLTGHIYHDPKIEFNEAAYNKGEQYMDKLYMLNLYQHLGWETLKQDIVAAGSEGVKAVFIDPITNLTNGMSSTERNDALMGISQELAAMALDLEMVIFIFCHLNKPPSGVTPFDRGGIITTNYFAGSSAMARSCNYAIGLQGNRDPDLSEEERNTRQLVLLADREFGESGSVNLFWNKKTGLFAEI